jgi:hypothetical protein
MVKETIMNSKLRAKPLFKYYHAHRPYQNRDGTSFTIECHNTEIMGGILMCFSSKTALNMLVANSRGWPFSTFHGCNVIVRFGRPRADNEITMYFNGEFKCEYNG